MLSTVKMTMAEKKGEIFQKKMALIGESEVNFSTHTTVFSYAFEESDSLAFRS
jgi:hypothetical protein